MTPSRPAEASASLCVARLRRLVPRLSDACVSLLQTVVAALFLLTFVIQPYLIPSESMEKTLLVGDFLLVNKQAYAPAAGWNRWIMPYQSPQHGDILVFRHPRPALLIKRVIALPGDRLRVASGRVLLNGRALDEPYLYIDPAAASPYCDEFPARVGGDPDLDLIWRRRMPLLVDRGELVIPPGQLFVMGDNRRHSVDSRYWGLVAREAVDSKPLAIYFSYDALAADASVRGPDDRLGLERGVFARLIGFVRWKRIFRVIH